MKLSTKLMVSAIYLFCIYLSITSGNWFALCGWTACLFWSFSYYLKKPNKSTEKIHTSPPDVDIPMFYPSPSLVKEDGTFY